MPEQKKASLRDVINYEADTFLSEDEVSLIRNVFADQKVIRVLRKVLLPSVNDPSLPPEEINMDMWLDRDYSQIPNEQIKSIVLARQEAIKFVMGGIVKLKVLASSAATETEAQRQLRIAQDSAK